MASEVHAFEEEVIVRARALLAEFDDALRELSCVRRTVKLSRSGMPGPKYCSELSINFWGHPPSPMHSDTVDLKRRSAAGC